jgi:hypothetical protein
MDLSTWVHAHPLIPQFVALAVLCALLAFRVRNFARRRQTPVSEPIVPTEPTVPQTTDPLATRPLAQRVGGGAVIGLLFPGVFSILILLTLFVGGRHQVDDHGNQPDVLALFAYYLLGSAAMGAILGLFWPRLRNPLAAILTGCVATAPLVLGISSAMTPSHPDLMIGLTVLFGTVVGLSARRAILRPKPPTGTPSP